MQTYVQSDEHNNKNTYGYPVVTVLLILLVPIASRRQSCVLCVPKKMHQEIKHKESTVHVRTSYLYVRHPPKSHLGATTTIRVSPYTFFRRRGLLAAVPPAALLRDDAPVPVRPVEAPVADAAVGDDADWAGVTAALLGLISLMYGCW